MIGLDISQFEEFADLSTHIESDDEEEDDSLLARMLQEVAVPSKQAFLCVLDVRDGELMLRKVGGETVVKRMLQYITDLAKQRVIACPTDKFGVVLFGVPSQGEGVFRCEYPTGAPQT
ncbi:MAG: hypothetical protein KVP17_001210 [Porospora cf. gigantea B]|uniref:uncharacterized protein n=1 Tax=Porospora cf. gigantea B TaxID=2853592 RepID=UPI003571F0DA|nr:MAG: hypothetical protein KVP17_001210 [Porospora cf. gigantea B]